MCLHNFGISKMAAFAAEVFWLWRTGFGTRLEQAGLFNRMRQATAFFKDVENVHREEEMFGQQFW